MYLSVIFTILCTWALAPRVCAQTAKFVFCHYMVGTVTQEHAQQDIDDARNMGLDGFALNIGDPTQPFVADTLSYMFNYASGFSNFHLYISMDLYAQGNACYQGSTACDGPFDYLWIFNEYFNYLTYFNYGGFPVVSTFSSGGFLKENFTDWKTTLPSPIFFMPDFDETAGYWTGDDAWYYYWGDVVDGLLSWESAWPSRDGGPGGAFPGDINPDIPVMAGASSNEKAYMMPVSSLQFKDSYGTNIYRPGDLTLPQRLYSILDNVESINPDLLQIISWNDGPESHYIGNLWPEQNTDALPNSYANQVIAPHTAWRWIIRDCIAAFKNSVGPAEALPGDDVLLDFAMWYKPILQNSTCDVNANDIYSDPPDNFGAGNDDLHWAAVVPVSLTGYTIQAYSDNGFIGSQVLHLGLIFGSFTGLQAGAVRIELWDATGLQTTWFANGPTCVSLFCTTGYFNMNYQVVGMVDTGFTDADGLYSGCFPQSLSFPAINSFVALGDSYSAGIGAGDWVGADQFDPNDDCLKGKNAYAYALQNTGGSMTGSEAYHTACSGAVTHDIASNGLNNRAPQITMMGTVANYIGWGTLSIGGNDVGFSSIAIYCLEMNWGCDDAKKNMAAKIASDEFFAGLTSAYVAILEAAVPDNFFLIVTGYLQFFSAADTGCDDKYFGYGNYLTQALREELNGYAVSLNEVIELAVVSVNQNFIERGSNKRIYYQNWDLLYEGHRFCEPTYTGTDSWYKEAWFLTVYGDDQTLSGEVIGASNNLPPDESYVDLLTFYETCDPNDNSDETSFLLCNWSNFIVNGTEAAGPDVSDTPFTILAPAEAAKAFHPKSVGHQAVANAIYNWLVGNNLANPFASSS